MSCQVPSLQFALLPDVPVRPPSGYLKVYVGPDGELYARKSNGDVRALEVELGPSLESIKALEPIPADTFLYTNGTNQFNESPISSFARTLLVGANAGTMRSTLGLVIGTDVQAHSADLDSFVTNASWSGSNLTLAGAVIAASVFSNGSLTCLGPATITGELVAEADIIGLGFVTTVLGVEIAGGPTLTAGSAVPSAVEPEGSIYLRTGGANGSIYVRQAAAWVLK